MSISYPVDPDSRWARWSISNSEIIKHNKPWPRADGMEVVGMDADLVPLLEVNEDQPVYDPATHYLSRTAPVVDVANNTHTHGYEVLPRSQEDLDADAEREQAKALYAALQSGSGNATTRTTRLENVVSYMLKDMYGE